MLKDAPHPKSAVALVSFLLRPDIQAKFAGADFEYPVRPDVPSGNEGWGKRAVLDVEMIRAAT